jgi:hypothetical protein
MFSAGYNLQLSLYSTTGNATTKKPKNFVIWRKTPSFAIYFPGPVFWVA